MNSQKTGYTDSTLDSAHTRFDFELDEDVG